MQCFESSNILGINIKKIIIDIAGCSFINIIIKFAMNKLADLFATKKLQKLYCVECVDYIQTVKQMLRLSLGKLSFAIRILFTCIFTQSL